MNVGDRIKARLEALDMSQAELARRVRLAQPTINNLINHSKVGSKHLHKIARELATSPEYLTGETDDPSNGYFPSPTIATVADELGIVGLRELDLNLGMGATYLDVPVTETTRYFDREWLRDYTKSLPENLIFAMGVGDSMEPTIKETDLLLIDCSQNSITMTDKFWAIAYANCGAVKRLRPRADGGVEMISDNPLVPNDVAYDGEMHVLGRVVAIVRRM